MTHRLLVALLLRGHEVTVYQTESGAWTYEGIVVKELGALKPARPDVLIAHADFAMHARFAKRAAWVDEHWLPLVGICHNIEPAVREGILSTPFSLVVTNAQWMHDAIRAETDSLVVRPPFSLPEQPVEPGEHVTIVNFNENKGGPFFFKLAAHTLDVPFLAVRGGYGEQVAPRRLPDNTRVFKHIAAENMDREVWANTKILVMPSERETWGSTASEAIARGIPVICSPTPGLRENLDDAGFYVERGDLEGYQDIIRRLVADDELYRQASNRAMRRSLELEAQSRRDIKSFVDAVEALEVRRDAAVAG